MLLFCDYGLEGKKVNTGAIYMNRHFGVELRLGLGYCVYTWLS